MQNSTKIMDGREKAEPRGDPLGMLIRGEGQTIRVPVWFCLLPHPNFALPISHIYRLVKLFANDISNFSDSSARRTS